VTVAKSAPDAIRKLAGDAEESVAATIAPLQGTTERVGRVVERLSTRRGNAGE